MDQEMRQMPKWLQYVVMAAERRKLPGVGLQIVNSGPMNARGRITRPIGAELNDSSPVSVTQGRKRVSSELSTSPESRLRLGANMNHCVTMVEGLRWLHAV